MLVLTRFPGEKIVIGGDIVVTVIDRKGDKIRVGIDAPDDVEIHRMEVQQAIWRQEAARREGGGA